MTNHTILRLIAAILITIPLLAGNRAMAQTPAGSVTSVTGDVHLVRAGTTTVATPGTALDVGDRLVTGPSSRVTITLTDNSKLELDESTSLVIDQQMVGANSRNTKLSLFSGLVRSFVSYTSAPTPNFEVHTPNAVASARGTQYDTSTSTQPPSTTSEEDRRSIKIAAVLPKCRSSRARSRSPTRPTLAADLCEFPQGIRRWWYVVSLLFRQVKSPAP